MTDYRILILDDDPDDAFLVSETLSDVLTTSYETTSCTTTTEAFERLTAEPFDLLICDYQLGGEDGASFISSLKPRGIELPAILLTGMTHEEAERLAIEAGAVDFLPKGELSATVLDRTIRFAIANVRRHGLLSTMVDCMDAAVCIDDGAGRPELWNAGFMALASRYAAATKAVSCDEVGDLLHSTLQGRVSSVIGDVMVDLNITRIADGRSVVTLHDVSEHVRALQQREEAVRKADHLATHCCLTKLPNRNAITARIDEATAAVAADGETEFTLFVLDLDRFKAINDVHGHAVGDAVLIQVAERMRATLGPLDSLGRMGGDEFVILSNGCANAEKLAHDLLASFDLPFEVDGILHSLGVSIGIATCPQHGRTTQELMSNADHAMYRAKKDPAVPYLCYTDEIDRQTRERLHLVSDLKEAIANDAIDVHFQPQVDANTGDLSGFEALARWNRPGFGAVPPARFIPVAEAEGLVPVLGAAVLRKACMAAVGWPLPVSVAVNVSGLQICDPDFDRTVHQALLQTKLSPQRLELEVTESVLMHDMHEPLAVLRRLKALGVSLAIDDFGTGYSSLTSLASFPFDLLKVDRAFVRDMCADNRMDTLVRACVNLGKSLNLCIIAEGVEHEQQARRLTELGCDNLQGYLFGHAMPNDDAIALQWRNSGLRDINRRSA